MNALVVGNGSYIVRPCGHDLRGPTDTVVHMDTDQNLPLTNGIWKKNVHGAVS